MATKSKSSEIVDEEADINRRFESLESNAAESNDILKKIAAKVLGTAPEPKPKDKNDHAAEPKPKSKNILVSLGILSAPESE